MTRKSNNSADSKEFIALLSSDGETLVGFTYPAKGYEMQDIVDGLNAKNVNAEIRTPDTTIKKALI
jgi:hypothetical protein